MEAAKWNLRECSVRLRRCDFAGRGSVARAGTGALAELHESVTPTAPRDVKDCDDMNLMVKMEFKVEDSLSGQELYTKHTSLQENSVTDIGLCIKKECHEIPPTVIKIEYDAEDTLTAQRTHSGASCVEDHLGDMKSLIREECHAIPPTVIKIEYEAEDVPTAREPHAKIPHVGEDHLVDINLVREENDIMKTDNGRNKVTIKEELDIGPIVLQPKNVPHPVLPLTSVPSHINPAAPRLSTDSADGAGPVPLCLVPGQPEGAPHTEVKDYYRMKDSEILADIVFVPHSTKIEGVYHRVLSEQTCDLSDSEGISVGRLKGSQSRYCVEPSTESDINSLKTIVHTHTNVKPYRCEVCEYSASRLGYLKKHLRTHMGEKPYKCEKCEYSACIPDDLKRHMRTHTSEKLYSCKHCEYRASYPSYLKQHMSTHTGEKPYKCEQCEYSVSRLWHLKRHMSTHTGEKSYRCEHCEYSSFRLDNLKIHMLTHTGEKQYRCKQCKYSSFRLDNLKVHMRTHTGEKPYSCKHCEYSAPRSDELKRHMRTHTTEKTV